MSEEEKAKVQDSLNKAKGNLKKGTGKTVEKEQDDSLDEGTVKKSEKAVTTKKKKVNSNTKMSSLKKGQWGDLLMNMVQEIKEDPEAFAFTGGLNPVDRRLLLDQLLKASQIQFFAATCEYRGHSLVNYSTKSDESAQTLREIVALVDLKGERLPGEKTAKGKVSVVAMKVAYSEVFVALRSIMGPAKFDGKTYKGKCPDKYQWNGSLGSMYLAIEETDEVAAWTAYIEVYEHFSNWYLATRAEAAKANGNNKAYVKPTDAKVQAAIEKTRSYYRLALGSFSKATRKAWAEGNFDVDMEKGTIPDETVIKNIVAALD